MDKEITDGVVITEGTDHLKPIKDAVGSVGIEMPDLVAEGDLTVDSKKETVKKEPSKKDTPLPEMGAKFMLNGHEYKVIYLNKGQHRFSCEPCLGIY